MIDWSLNACNDHGFHFSLDHRPSSKCDEDHIIEGEARVEKTIRSGYIQRPPIMILELWLSMEQESFH